MKPETVSKQTLDGIYAAQAILSRQREHAIREAIQTLRWALETGDYDLRLAVEDVISDLRDAL